MRTLQIIATALFLLLIGAEARGQEETDESDLLWSKGLELKESEISPDGRFVAVSHGNFKYSLFDASNGELIHEFEMGTGSANDIIFSKDSKKIYFGGNSNGIYVFDIETNTLQDNIDFYLEEGEDTQPVLTLDLSKSGTYLGATIWDYGYIIIDIETEEIVLKKKFSYDDQLHNISFSHDNTMYAVSNDNVTFIYDFESGEEITKIRGRDPKFSPTKDEIYVLGYETNKGFEPLYYDLSNIDEVDIFTEGFNYWRGNKHTDIGFDISRDGQYAVIVSGRYSAVQFFNIENDFSEDYKFIFKDPGRWLDDIKISESNRLICSDGYFLFCIDPDFTTPVEELAIEPEPELFVNIQDDILYVSLSESIGIGEPFALFTIDGRYIDMYMPESTDPTIPTAIDISNLSSGSYILSYKSDSILLSKTFNIIK